MNPRDWGARGPLLQHWTTLEGDNTEAPNVRAPEYFTENVGQPPVNNSRCVLRPLAPVLVEGDRDANRLHVQHLRDLDRLSKVKAHAVAGIIWGGAR
jgi:hypothetical protein